MGYEIHITRKEFWADEDSAGDISLEEWKNFVESQPDMRLDNYAEVGLPDGKILRHESQGLSIWLSYSGNGKNGNYAWFSYSSGNITVKNPDEEILEKMCLVALLFNAKVQGDDGEFYEDGILVKSLENTSSEKNKKPWWQFW